MNSRRRSLSFWKQASDNDDDDEGNDDDDHDKHFHDDDDYKDNSDYDDYNDTVKGYWRYNVIHEGDHDENDCEDNGDAYLIFVSFSPQAQFLVQIFSTQKRVNRNKKDFVTKSR